MAIVRELQRRELDGSARHSEVEATIALVKANGEPFVQIGTSGSRDRALPGKTSQSLRLSQTAFVQLVELGNKHFK